MTDVRIPKVGMSTIEVDVTEIVATVGSRVAEGEALLTVSTDKVDFDVESPCAGLLTEIHVEVDGVYPVGHIAARIEPA